MTLVKWLKMKDVSRDEIKKGAKYYIVNKYEYREYIGIVIDVHNRNFTINILDSYDPFTKKVPHIGLRYMISEFLLIYEMVPEGQRNIETKAFNAIMNDLIPGFNINYL